MLVSIFFKASGIVKVLWEAYGMLYQGMKVLSSSQALAFWVVSQRAQYPLNKEYRLNHNMKLYTIKPSHIP